MRLEFSAKTRDQAAQRAGGHCEKCGHVFGRKKPVFDHILPAAYGGQPGLANCQVICEECHKAKTKDDVRGMRKADRQRRSHNGAELPKQPIKSRGFDQKKPKTEKLPVPGPRRIYKQGLNIVPLTPVEFSAAVFVKELAAHADGKNGKKPTRETQKKVAAVVRKEFFNK